MSNGSSVTANDAIRTEVADFPATQGYHRFGRSAGGNQKTGKAVSLARSPLSRSLWSCAHSLLLLISSNGGTNFMESVVSRSPAVGTLSELKDIF